MKMFIWVGMAFGSIVFSAIPMLWGDDLLSATSFALSFVGAVVGLIGGWKLGQSVGA